MYVHWITSTHVKSIYVWKYAMEGLRNHKTYQAYF